MKATLKRSKIGKSSASQPKANGQDFSDFGYIKSNTYTKNPTGGHNYNGTQGVLSKVKKGNEGGRGGDGFYVEEALGWKKGDVANNRKDNTNVRTNYHAKYDNDTNAFVANNGHTAPNEKTEAVKLLRLQKESPLWPSGTDSGNKTFGQNSVLENNKVNKSGLSAGSPQNPVKAGAATKKTAVNGANSNKGFGLGKSGKGGSSTFSKGATFTSYGQKKAFNKNQRLG
jgi:hypothetical protein